MTDFSSFILSQKYPEKLLAVTQRITIFAIHYITELSHVGELREVREKLRDKCPTSYGKRLLSLNFPNDRRE